jgi:hypothetical protein
MPLINFQPNPKIPPIGFFQPISTDPKDMMTDVEYLLGILKKLNEVIKQVNSNTEFIENYAGKIEEIEAEVASLRQEMTAFEEQINSEINDRFAQIKIELQSMIATTLVQANAYTDATAANLRDEIRQIALGQITVFDPTSGMLNNLQDTLDNMYGATREEAITASEYDTLELTATTYDGYEITAFDYDRYAKTILMGESA